MLAPAMQSISIPFSSSTWMTPMCASPFAAAGGKREADAAAGDFAGETVDVQIEAVVGHATAPSLSGKPRAKEWTGWPSSRAWRESRARRWFLGEEDRLHMARMRRGAVAELAHEQLEIVKILRARLEQHEGEIGLDDACDR